MGSYRFLWMAAFAVGLAISVATRALTDEPEHTSYVQTNLVSNAKIPAHTTDPNLLNAWGIAFFPGSPFWINDNGKGVATLYDGTGKIVPLVVTIPPPSSSANPTSAPTGLVANPTTQFVIPGTTLPALFIFDTEDGTILGWNPGVDLHNAKIIVDKSTNPTAANGAVYKGLAFGTNATGNFVYATNFRAGTIDVFDSTFAPATLSGSFTDARLPHGYGPFGIANVNGDLFVTYAKQNDARHDDVAGPGNGFVDIFDTDGRLLRRFASRGSLNSPWGIVQAGFRFGQFSGELLVANFGDGTINVFDPNSASFLGQLEDRQDRTIVIDGLWSLTRGGAQKSDPDAIYFTAGPNGESDGLFGRITAGAPPTADND